MSELDEMREKIAEELYKLDYGRPRAPFSNPVVKRASLLKAANLLSLSTDTLRIAVVRKEGELPHIDDIDWTWKVNSGDYHIDDIKKGAAYQLKIMLKEGWVKEVKP